MTTSISRRPVALAGFVALVLLATHPAASTPIAPTPSWIAFGQSAAHYGTAVAGAGDVNDDGFADILVGGDLFDRGETDEGGAWLYLGSAAGVDTTADWSGEGNGQNAYFGYAVAGAGDVNGDGFADALIGIPGRNQARVYTGGPGGLSPTPAWTAFGSGSFGLAVAGAGDVNGDGYDDVVVGAVNDSNGQIGEGRAFVYMGSAAGLAALPAWTGEGAQTGARFAYSVGTAGDVNGDGYDDLIVGAAEYDAGETNEGRAYVFLGSAAGLAATPVWSAESDQPDTYFGFSVGSAGDVNGDGYDEVLVGATWYAVTSPDDGRAYVFLGSAGGPAALPAWTTTGSHEELGFWLDSAGDVNDDGFADVIVGAPHHHDPDYAEGAALVFLGSPAGLSPEPDWTGQGNIFEAHFGQAVAGAGDVNGDGADDVLIGAPFSHCPVFPPCGPIPNFAALHAGIRGPGAVGGGAAPLPPALALAVEPNPFSPPGRGRFTLAGAAPVLLTVFDVQGRAVKNLVRAQREPGVHAFWWDGTDAAGSPLASGVYFLELAAGEESVVRKMILAR
jgi:hypothetical protein